MKSSKKYLNLVGVILVLVLYACSDTDITSLSTTKVLDIEKNIEIPNACYTDAFICDSLLVLIANPSCDTNFFHVYNKNSLEFITSFGEKGRSPQEFSFPMFYRNNTTLPDQESVWDFYDINNVRKISINFRSIVNGVNPYECIESSVLEKNLLYAIDLSYLFNNKVVGRNISESEGLFFIADIKSGEMDWVDYIPKMKMGNQYKTLAYYGYLWSNSKSIMYASRHFDQVLFFDVNGELVKEHNFSKIRKPILSKNFAGLSEKAMHYFMHVYGTHDNCYALRVGRTDEDFYKNINSPSLILVFDWNGNLKDIYEHKSFPSPFCVDNKTNTMYCIINSDDADNPNVKLQKIPL